MKREKNRWGLYPRNTANEGSLKEVSRVRARELRLISLVRNNFWINKEGWMKNMAERLTLRRERAYKFKRKSNSAIISMVKHRISCLRIVLRAQCTVRIGFNDCSYLPISRCWQGENCSTSWMNYATFGFDLDCYLCSSSLERRDSCTTYGWPLTLDARFLNRPCGCMKYKKNKQHDRSAPQVDLASICWSRRLERFIG